MFGNMPLTETEREHWCNFMEYCGAMSLSVSQEYLDYNTALIRFLQATRWDYAKTYEAIEAHHQWYTTTLPYLPPSRAGLDLVESGFMYIHKRDQCGRCIVVCDVPKIASQLSEENKILPTAVQFLLTYLIEKCAVPGKSEAWNMIIDLKGLGITDVPMKALKKLLLAAQDNFRGRAYRVFVVNAGLVIRASFKIVKTMLDEFTVQKVNVLGDDFQKKLTAAIEPNCLEERFGGSLPTKTGNFFPPDMSQPNERMVTVTEAKKIMGLEGLDG